jgi:hypothetical protein
MLLSSFSMLACWNVMGAGLAQALRPFACHVLWGILISADHAGSSPATYTGADTSFQPRALRDANCVLIRASSGFADSWTRDESRAQPGASPI